MSKPLKSPCDTFFWPRRVSAADAREALPWGAWARILLRAVPKHVGPIRILELFADDSRVAWYLRACLGTTVAQYVVTHPEAERESRLGRTVSWARATPERLPFWDGAFDVVCGHHVLSQCKDPRSAAAEITRVAKRRVVLLERNGLGARHLAATLTGGASPRSLHPPWRMRSWFPRQRFAWLGLRPVPLHGRADTWRARAPGIRWQCGAVLICGERTSWTSFGRKPVQAA